jgi:hypothetical protein
VEDKDNSRPPPVVPGRDVEPFIYIPAPPKGWITIRVRTIRDLTVIVMGVILLGSQVYDDLVHHMEPRYFIVVAGLTCLGYQAAIRRDRTKHDSQVVYQHDAD